MLKCGDRELFFELSGSIAGRNSGLRASPVDRFVTKRFNIRVYMSYLIFSCIELIGFFPE